MVGPTTNPLEDMKICNYKYEDLQSANDLWSHIIIISLRKKKHISLGWERALRNMYWLGVIKILPVSKIMFLSRCNGGPYKTDNIPSIIYCAA